jgi:hypothetical protein
MATMMSKMLGDQHCAIHCAVIPAVLSIICGAYPAGQCSVSAWHPAASPCTMWCGWICFRWRCIIRWEALRRLIRDWLFKMICNQCNLLFGRDAKLK